MIPAADNQLNRRAALRLGRGSHAQRSDGMCAMEAVAWLAGLPHSDIPECTCPVLAIYVQALNDHMSDRLRQQLVPHLPALIGTRQQSTEPARAALLARAAWELFLPLCLRRIGLQEMAERVAQTNLQAAPHSQLARDISVQCDRVAGDYADEHELNIRLSPSRLPTPLYAALEVARSLNVLVSQLQSDQTRWATTHATPAASIIANTAEADSQGWAFAIKLLQQLIQTSGERSKAA